MGWNNSDLFFDMPDLLSMKLFFWNYCSTGNTNVRNNMSDMMRDYNPEIVILLETRVTLINVNGFFN